jgi:hypothetical protein
MQVKRYSRRLAPYGQRCLPEIDKSTFFTIIPCSTRLAYP